MSDEWLLARHHFGSLPLDDDVAWHEATADFLVELPVYTNADAEERRAEELAAARRAGYADAVAVLRKAGGMCFSEAADELEAAAAEADGVR